MELLIGRDAATSRLSITIDGKKKAVYGEPQSVPKSVSREHCKVSIVNNIYKISNANPNNITYVNGNQIEQKSFNPQIDTIALGSCRYDLNIAAILQAVMPQPCQAPQQQKQQTPVQTYSIKHLEKIWETNHNTKLEFNIKQQKTNAVRSGTGILTMGAMIYGFTQGKEAVEDGIKLNVILYALAFAVTLFFFIRSYIAASKNPLYLDKLDKEFRKDYVCPNPDCHSFFNYSLPYEELLKKGACPYCKSKFTNK